ncbi:MAG: DUF3788 family protein [Candidatus Sulfotelmatobacter sp.]
MLRNAFVGQAKRPTERELASELELADALWRGLVADLKRDLILDAEEWNSYSVKAGWSLRLQSKKRNIVYLSPGAGCFLASFALGDKAVAAARTSALPSDIVKIIDEAKRYPEGTAVRIEVHDATDASIVKTLARIKIEN